MRESWRHEVAGNPQCQAPWRWEGQRLGTDAGRGRKGAGFVAFPLQLETKADSCVPLQQSGPSHSIRSHPPEWRELKEIPLASGLTQPLGVSCKQSLSQPPYTRRTPFLLETSILIQIPSPPHWEWFL